MPFMLLTSQISPNAFRWHNLSCYYYSFKHIRRGGGAILPPFMIQKFHLCTLAALSSSAHSDAVADNTIMSNRKKRKARQLSPEGILKSNLDDCSKRGDLHEALRLYDEARSSNIHLSRYHYNVLLYLCSLPSQQSPLDSSSSPHLNNLNGSSSKLGLQKGFEIFQQMVSDRIDPDEATFTNAARIAIAAQDPHMAFNLVKQMKEHNISPKLRSYGPALFGFCNMGLVDRAYEVDSHMVESGVMPEEPELSALLKLSVDNSKADKVYELLHRLRATVRQVTDPTARIIEDWFASENAAIVGDDHWDVAKVKEAVRSGGGGWHGQGWLGTGTWKLERTLVDDSGVCGCCGEELVCIDIDPRETENFASSLSDLACQREAKAEFVRFKDWLQRHGPFDAVVDGANVGLVNGHEFNFRQVNNVVKQLREMSPAKRLPLVVLHRNRVTGGPAQNPNNKKLLDTWKKSGALYATPTGSNDDWYWLYASVSNNCLLVTNDEMRDHLFQLLGSSFFPRWKEKHQARLSVSTLGLKLHMPPPYSIVIQESENGGWHVPTISSDDLQTPRQWLCATRSRR